MADDPKRYLRRNWANVAIIFVAFCGFHLLNQVGALRALRFYVLIAYLVHNFNVVRQILHMHHLVHPCYRSIHHYIGRAPSPP